MSFLCAEWFTTAYARNTPLPLALCAFDLFSVHLEDGMIRLGLGILEVKRTSIPRRYYITVISSYGGVFEAEIVVFFGDMGMYKKGVEYVITRF